MNKKKKVIRKKKILDIKKYINLLNKKSGLIKRIFVAVVLIIGILWFGISLYKQLEVYRENSKEITEVETNLVLAYTREFTIAKRLDETKYEKFFDLDCEKHMKDCIAFGNTYREELFSEQDNNSDEDIYNVLNNLEINTIKQLELYEESNVKRDEDLKGFPIILFSPFL